MPSCIRKLIYSSTCFHCCHIHFLCRHSKHLVFRSSFISFDRILTFASVNRNTFLPDFALLQNAPLFALWLLIFAPYYFFSSDCFQTSDSVTLFFDMCVYVRACKASVLLVVSATIKQVNKFRLADKLFLRKYGNLTVSSSHTPPCFILRNFTFVL